MSIRFLCSIILCITCNFANSQKYFDFISTNVSVSTMGPYSNSFITCQGFVRSGKYWDDCKNCGKLIPGGKTQPSMIDSLNKKYLELCPRKLYSSQYVPHKYFSMPDSAQSRYMMKTLYKIEGDKLTPIYQLKIVFASTQTNSLPDVYSIELYDGDTGKSFSSKIVMDEYTKKIEEDKKDPGPPIDPNPK